MDFLKGKKTYVIAGLFVLMIIIPLVAGFVIPEWVYGILASFGLAAVRAGMQEVSGNKGWRTYAAAALVGVVSLGSALGWTWLPVDVIYSLAGVLGIVGIRKAVGKLK